VFEPISSMNTMNTSFLVSTLWATIFFQAALKNASRSLATH
jgi:hypothetical protein